MWAFLKIRTALWLVLSTVLVPAVLTVSVGILILVFYREAWDVAFGVLVLCFAVFAVVGSSLTLFLLGRSNRLARMQSEFIANISHDFRTPLTSIRMYVETLRAGRADAEGDRRQCLEVLTRETAHMERLVERVLTFRRLEGGARGLEHAPCSPEDVLTMALAPFRLSHRTGAQIKVVVEPDLPQILADDDLLTEAIRNLVSNALRYGGGDVVVTARIESGGGVAFVVRDGGPPIPRRERRKIFKRFYRVPGSPGRGSGLGLAIARRVARAHGGELVLRSSVEAGNVFTLRVPAAQELPTGRGEASGAAVEPAS